MKPIHALLASTVVSLGLAGAAGAQDASLRDVPPGHWASDAVQDLARQEVLRGYPDGTFQGKRAITRYEAAVGLARLRGVIETNIQRGIEDASREIGLAGAPGPRGPEGPRGVQGPPGPRGPVPPELRQLQQEQRGFRQDISALQRLFQELSSELHRIRGEVDGVSSDLGDITARVSRIRRGSRGIGAFGFVVEPGPRFHR
jgi:hypothetical protein